MKITLLKKSLVFGKIFFGLILVLVIVVSVFPLLPPFKNYYHSRTVLTGSMEPKIPKGSVVINQWADQKNLEVGDVITYQHPADKKIVYITHRIVKIDKTGLLWRFETKGDANPASDFGLVTQAGTEGKVILTIPFIGYLIEFFKTPIGFILLIALPLLIFIVRQTRDVLEMWKKRETPPTLVVETKPKRRKSAKRKTRKTLAVMLVALAFLAARVSFVTYASFTSGQATITGVTLSTAASFGSDPQSGDVVINEILPDPVGADDAAKPNGEWIELYNRSDSVVDVTGWYLYDAIDSHALPIKGGRTNTGGTQIQAHGFLVVYRAGDSNFSLNQDAGGDTVRLYNGSISTGNLIDSHTYIGPVPEGKSIARIPDGTGPWVDPIPTPGEPNRLESDVIPVSPSAQLTLSADQKHISFVVDHVGNFKSLSYQLSYDTSTVPQGVFGKADIIGDSYSSGDILLGTCSTGGTCVFHQGVKNFNLEVNLIDSLNQTITIKTSL